MTRPIGFPFLRPWPRPSCSPRAPPRQTCAAARPAYDASDPANANLAPVDRSPTPPPPLPVTPSRRRPPTAISGARLLEPEPQRLLLGAGRLGGAVHRRAVDAGLLGFRGRHLSVARRLLGAAHRLLRRHQLRLRLYRHRFRGRLLGSRPLLLQPRRDQCERHPHHQCVRTMWWSTTSTTAASATTAVRTASGAWPTRARPPRATKPTPAHRRAALRALGRRRSRAVLRAQPGAPAARLHGTRPRTGRRLPARWRTESRRRPARRSPQRFRLPQHQHRAASGPEPRRPRPAPERARALPQGREAQPPRPQVQAPPQVREQAPQPACSGRNAVPTIWRSPCTTNGSAAADGSARAQPAARRRQSASAAAAA